ncbi:hypothetical protein B0J14DRAFT_563378 [Halenospora varia]|nr:hypothetical protein B0J14DRAFT_563378 [Halenospora varia]
MDDLSRRREALAPKIEELMKIAGTLGLSLGVLHQGKTIHVANFGCRDVAAKLPTTDETIYLLCSLTKVLLAATVTIHPIRSSGNTTILDFPPKEDPNVAKAYSTVDDTSPAKITTVQATDKIFSGAVAGFRTCVKDPPVLYDALMSAANNQISTGKPSTPGSPLKQK